MTLKGLLSFIGCYGWRTRNGLQGLDTVSRYKNMNTVMAQDQNHVDKRNSGLQTQKKGQDRPEKKLVGWRMWEKGILRELKVGRRRRKAKLVEWRLLLFLNRKRPS